MSLRTQIGELTVKERKRQLLCEDEMKKKTNDF